MPLKLLSKLSFHSMTKKKVGKIFVLIFFLTFISTVIYFFVKYFSVRSIEIESSENSPEVIGLTTLKNSNLIFLNEAKIEKSLLENNTNLKEIKLEKKYPNTLILKIKLNQPLAYLKLNQGYAAISENAKVIYKTKSEISNKTVIKYYQTFYYQQIQPNINLNFRDLEIALFFLKKLKDFDIKVDSIDINSLNMLVFNINQKKILFTSDRTKGDQSYELETLIKQFKIEAKDFKILDLRFNKPVVTF